MSKYIRSKFLVSLLACAFLLPVAYADFDNGFAAYEKQDYTTALKEFRASAEQGDAYAQVSVGLMYANGEGVPQDYREAVVWFRKAAEQGNVIAQFNLAVMYDKGQGVPQDYREAVVWYRKAAEQGHASAQNNVGVMYEYGDNVAKNPVIAYALYNLSVAAGNEKARSSRDRVAEKLSSKQLAQGQALSLKWKVGDPLPR